MMDSILATIFFAVIALACVTCIHNEHITKTQCESHGGNIRDIGRGAACVKEGLLIDIETGKPL